MLEMDLQQLRPRLMSVAYRMLGSVMDAEDAVQDAFLRLQSAENVVSPEGFLVKATTRRCIDQLRAQRRRETYVGPWVPEPVETRQSIPVDALAESLTQAFLLMLERLSPTERAAFLLRTVFAYDYSEIAEILGKTDAHIRQIVSRARLHIEQNRPRFHSSPQQAHELAERFLAACRTGDARQVERLFTDDAEVHSDGGGKVAAARVVISGRSRAARFLAGVFSKKHRASELHLTNVNGEPGVMCTSQGEVVLVASLHIEEKVRAVYLTNNPDKLARWSQATIE